MHILEQLVLGMTLWGVLTFFTIWYAHWIDPGGVWAIVTDPMTGTSSITGRVVFVLFGFAYYVPCAIVLIGLAFYNLAAIVLFHCFMYSMEFVVDPIRTLSRRLNQYIESEIDKTLGW